MLSVLYGRMLQIVLRGSGLPGESVGCRLPIDPDTPELPILVAHGYFFENDWSADGTVSYVGPVSEVE